MKRTWRKEKKSIFVKSVFVALVLFFDGCWVLMGCGGGRVGTMALKIGLLMQKLAFS
jgi:hypothetical protein